MIRTLAAALATTTCIVALATPAAAQTREFNVPAGSLRTALDTFARQSGRQVIYRDDVRSARSPGVRGARTAEEALNAILAGTGFVARTDRSGALAIVKVGNAPSAAGNLASSREGTAGSAPATDENAEIIVVGSRIGSRGDGPAPVAIVDRPQIDALGVTNVADVLNYLPQQSYSMGEANNFAGSRTLSLRGLSVGTTLTLINGRRTVTSALQGSSGAFDANTIPLSAVDHIEVLAGSASSIYGADAVGGVVNIVLKREIPRPVLDFYHGVADGGGEEARGSATLGLATSNFRASLVLDYFKRNPLYGRSRDLTSNQDFRRFGSTDSRVLTTNPANICSSTGANLPGLSAPCAVVPQGSSGVGLTPASFAATSGQTNRDSTSRFITLLPRVERKSAVGTIEFDLTPNIQLFSEGLYAKYDARGELAPNTVSNGLVPANNLFNPFGVAVRANYLLTGLGPRVDTFSDEYFRVTGGVTANFGKWSGEASVLYTKDDGTYVSSNRTNPTAVTAALASTNPSTALNVFQDGPGGSQALLASLLAAPVTNNFSSKAIQGSGFVRGPMFDLPAGSVEAVVGGEIRDEKILYNNAGIFLTANRLSKSGFFEVRVPITSAKMDVPLLSELAVLISGRYDHYDDFGGSFNPQIGVTWRPVPDLLIRSTYGDSFRAPSLFEAYQPRTVFQTTVPDPSRNNQVTTFPRTTGGNASLDPEKAKSFTAGAVLTPSFVPGLRLEATYWAIKQRSRIVRPSPAFLLGNPTLFGDRIVRAARTPADIAAGLPGQIVSLDATALNSGVLDTNGIDLAASYSFETSIGRFSPQVAATWVGKYQTADLPGAAVTDRKGVASIVGTIPEWRATGSLSWQKGPIGVSTTARYVSSYDDATSLSVRNGKRVNPPVIVDLQLSFDFSRLASAEGQWVHGTTIRFGARNLFDAAPPFSEVILPSGYDQSQADLRQRFLYLQISQKF